MIILKYISILWLVAFAINIFIVNRNKKFLKEYFDESEDLSMITFEFFENLIYLTCILFGPFLTVYLLNMEIKGRIILWKARLIVYWKIYRIKDKEVRKKLLKEVKEI